MCQHLETRLARHRASAVPLQAGHGPLSVQPHRPQVPVADGQRFEGIPVLAGVLLYQVPLDAALGCSLRDRGPIQVAVAGMNYPRLPHSALGDVGRYSGLMLFPTSARRAELGFELTDANLPDVVCISRLVEGLPLGIALAAAWLKVLTRNEIVDEIQ